MTDGGGVWSWAIQKPTLAPEGYMYYGELRFKDAKVRKNALIMPLKLFSGD